MHIKKIVPLLLVERIEPYLPLWEGLGMKRTVEVPHGQALGFVILAGSGTELMVQSRASFAADAAAVASRVKGSVLYCDVDSVVEAREAARAAGHTVLIEERKTAYGAREAWLIDADNNLVGFAEPA